MREERTEPVCFVATGKPCELGEFYSHPAGMSQLQISVPLGPGYRRLAPGWSGEAVERIKALLGTFRGGEACGHVTDAEILSALFPAPEEQPPEWAMEAARELIAERKAAVTPRSDNWLPTEIGIARLIARHAEGRK